MTEIDNQQPVIIDGDAAQEFGRLLSDRWSCRAFLSAPVPPAVVSQLFATAQRTASWCNTQPWHVHVASGAATKELAAELVKSAREGNEHFDFPAPANYSGVYQDRRREAGFALYDSLSIEKSDIAGRTHQMLKNFEFFGAPHVAIITTDREQGVYGAVDCGGYVANLLNAAHSLGLATIPQAAIAMQSDVVRSFFGLTDDRQVVCGVSFGYADLENPVNRFRTSRAEMADAVIFVG